MGFSPAEPKDSLSYLAMFRGSVATLFCIIIASVSLGSMIHWGAAEQIFDSGSLYLILLFASLTCGAIYSGALSQNRGWVTGSGVGLLTSLILLMIALGTGKEINWPIYLFKTLINCFIGAFGGIIGINTAENDR
jgi:putative membrane protein (TIGR04086 family)